MRGAIVKHYIAFIVLFACTKDLCNYDLFSYPWLEIIISFSESLSLHKLQDHDDFKINQTK